MTRNKFLRIFGVALLLSLLLVAAVATPTLALPTVALTPSSGATGITVSVVGTGFTPGASHHLYFSNQLATNLSLTFQTQVTVYKTVAAAYADTNGVINTSFVVPTIMDSTGSVAVAPGTYYVYVVVDSLGSIATVNTFVVIANPTITVSPTSGLAGTAVVVTGTGYVASTVLTFKFDAATVTPSAGQTSTLPTGTFSSTILVPDGVAAGQHTISATAGANTATATFTVNAAPSLDSLSPSTGPENTEVTITGSNFPGSAAITVKYEAVSIPITSGDTSTRVSGIFITKVNIPEGVSTGAHTITVQAGGGSATGTFTVTPSGSLNALSPNTGRAGTNVTVSGSSFPVGAALTFKFDGQAITPKSGDTSTLANGTFSTVIVIPDNASASAHTISVTAGSTTLTATFTVTGPQTALHPNITEGSIGASVVLVCTGFTPNGSVTVKFDEIVVVTSAQVDGTGLATPVFSIPASVHGNHTISVTDGTNSETSTFTVESTAPNAPISLGPVSGETLKSPYLFDCNDVTDPSIPVTYDFQIASNADFSSGTIVLSKTGLTESQYKLTATEASGLEGSTSVYYWRIRAVDAASNASNWGTSGQFNIAKPFEFKGWPVYVTIIAAAVVFFVLGLWLGRRTAFSY